MDEKQDLSKELDALKMERLARAQAREDAARDRKLAAAVAREKRAMEDDEVFAKLVDEHGDGNLTRINTAHGMVVVRAAEPLVHRRFTDETARADHPNPKVRMSMHDAAERFARHCRVHPTLPEFDELAKKCPGLVTVVANEAYDLGRPQVDEDAGK